MILTIREYDANMTAAVMDFTRRLEEGYKIRRLEEQLQVSIMPGAAQKPVYEKHYLAVDGQGAIRGAYILKHQAFKIGHETVNIGCYGLPVSEGIVNTAYTPLGVWLLRDAMERQPLLVALGMGGFKERLPKLLQAAGWPLATVPFFFRVVHPVPFLRNIVYLRRSVLHRRLFDLLAHSGAGIAWASAGRWSTASGTRSARHRSGMPC
jgi:hypothetical protein